MISSDRDLQMTLSILYFVHPTVTFTFKRGEAGSICVSLPGEINIIFLACLDLAINARVKERKTFRGSLAEIIKQRVCVLSSLA